MSEQQHPLPGLASGLAVAQGRLERGWYFWRWVIWSGWEFKLQLAGFLSVSLCMVWLLTVVCCRVPASKVGGNSSSQGRSYDSGSFGPALLFGGRAAGQHHVSLELAYLILLAALRNYQHTWYHQHARIQPAHYYLVGFMMNILCFDKCPARKQLRIAKLAVCRTP